MATGDGNDLDFAIEETTSAGGKAAGSADNNRSDSPIAAQPWASPPNLARSARHAGSTTYRRPETITEISQRRIAQARAVCINLGEDPCAMNVEELAQVLVAKLGEQVSVERMVSILSGETNLGSTEVDEFKLAHGNAPWALGLIWDVFGVHRGDEYTPDERLLPVIVVVTPGSSHIDVKLPEGYLSSAESVARIRNGKLFLEMGLVRKCK